MPSAWLLARTPDTALRLTGGLMGRAARVLSRVGASLPSTVKLFTEPNTHILAQTFNTAAPLRYGDYVAKISVAPLSTSVKELRLQQVRRDAGPDAQRDMVVDFFRSNSAEYEVRAQLCTDPDKMPIEDAKVPWPESDSPYIRVATITFPVQNADSPQRRAYADDVLSFNPWRSLADHRPLGSINRLKNEVYKASSRFRHEKNKVSEIEPTDIAQLPD